MQERAIVFYAASILSVSFVAHSLLKQLSFSNFIVIHTKTALYRKDKAEMLRCKTTTKKKLVQLDMN